MPRLFVVGIDAAFANMGFVRASVDLNSLKIQILSMHLISTEAEASKTVRKSSDALRRAIELKEALAIHSKGCTVAMAEIPAGSQSASAARALGIAVGVLASCPIPIFQVSPLEVKLASVGKRTAKKDDVISWAVKAHPEAEWLKLRNNILKKNEHLADAVATIHAGIKTEEFKQLRALILSTGNIQVATGRQRVKLL